MIENLDTTRKNNNEKQKKTNKKDENFDQNSIEFKKK